MKYKILKNFEVVWIYFLVGLTEIILNIKSFTFHTNTHERTNLFGYFFKDVIIIFKKSFERKKNYSFSGPLKYIIEPIDKIEIITPPLWKLIKWVGKYYMTPIGKVANTVVPKSDSSNYSPQKQKYITVKKKINTTKLYYC